MLILVYHYLMLIVILVFVSALSKISLVMTSMNLYLYIFLQNFNQTFFSTSLAKLLQINSDMNGRFIKFVSQCLYFEDENIGLVKFGKFMPQPRMNLAFENGRVCYWHSK